MNMNGEACDVCPIADRLRFANDLIVELQHELRELRHDVANDEAAAAGWPREATA